MCNCIEDINKKLEEMGNNTILDIPFSYGFDGIHRVERVRIATAKRDEKVRKKPISIQPAYCPFCGVEYSAQQTLALDASPQAVVKVEGN
jgi:hypothetical protein